MEHFESIGDVGWSDPRLADFAFDWALRFLGFVLGEPPKGVRIGVESHDHDLGAYRTLAVYWPEGLTEPRDFIRRAEKALCEFDQAVDWARLHPENFDAADVEGA